MFVQIKGKSDFNLTRDVPQILLKSFKLQPKMKKGKLQNSG